MAEHLITPPPDLVDEWRRVPEYTDGLGKLTMVTITVDRLQYIATLAACWGADQELEACCDWFQEFYKTESWVKHDLKHFRASRRPQPPSLKEQALELARPAGTEGAHVTFGPEELELIRRALEALDD